MTSSFYPWPKVREKSSREILRESYTDLGLTANLAVLDRLDEEQRAAAAKPVPVPETEPTPEPAAAAFVTNGDLHEAIDRVARAVSEVLAEELGRVRGDIAEVANRPPVANCDPDGQAALRQQVGLLQAEIGSLRQALTDMTRALLAQQVHQARPRRLVVQHSDGTESIISEDAADAEQGGTDDDLLPHPR